VTAAAAGERAERLFLPRSGARSKLALAVGMLGCAALGAGVYGAWLAPHSLGAAWPLLIAGVVALAAAALLGSKSAPPVRVGELGIIVGDPAEARRSYWYEVGAIRIADEALRVTLLEGVEGVEGVEGGAGGAGAREVVLPLREHGGAAAAIVAEASGRIGARVDISPKAHERLPKGALGEKVQPARLQLAGQKCAASGTSITFESDARLCDNCAALYHVDHVPAVCVRCERSLSPSAASAVRAAG
jgi:hypothetical protein